MSEEICFQCSYMGDKKYKLCAECFAKNQEAIKEFVGLLDDFKSKYGEETACEVVSELIGQRIETEEANKAKIFNPKISLS